MTAKLAELVTCLENACGGRERAVKVVMAICKYYGGQQLSLPESAARKSTTLNNMHGIIEETLDCLAANKAIQALCTYYGGTRLYVPLFLSAFRDELSDTIYKYYDGSKGQMASLCRRYHTTFVTIYRLWHRGRRRAAMRQQFRQGADAPPSGSNSANKYWRKL